MSNIDEIIQSLNNIPGLPSSFNKINEISKNPDVSPIDLNKVIMLDPILTCKVLKVVNSTYFSMTNSVNSIVKAIILVGVNTIRNLAFTSDFSNQNQKEDFLNWGLDSRGYWEHSIAVASITKLLGKHIGEPKEKLEEYYICGLVHDIGKVLFQIYFKEQYLHIINKSEEEGSSLIDSENYYLEMNHTQMGRTLAEQFSLSKAVMNSIEFHHNPGETDEKYSFVVSAVHLANYFVNREKIGFSGNYNNKEINPDVYNILKIKYDDMLSWKEIILQDIKKAYSFMKIS